MSDRTRRGVTLVELAVVICIIGAFVCALSPLVRKAKERAYQAACANNLRRISVALHKYALDHNGAFPAASNLADFANALADPKKGYADDLSIFVCPTTGHRKGAQGAIGRENIDYMYASGLTIGAPPSTPVCADRVRERGLLSKKDNHGRRGINVLSVNGDVAWMTVVPDGTWIRE